MSGAPSDGTDVSVSGARPSMAPRSAMSSMGERQARLLRIAVAVSVALHLVVFGAWVAWPQSSTARVDLDEAIIKTRLVKLGKPRDEKLLPRLPTSPPPPPPTESRPQPVVDPPKTPDTLPTPESKPSAADILNKFKSQTDAPRDIKDLIRDRIGEPTDEGRPDGDAEGAALEGEVTASYFARVTSRIQNAMEVSSVLTDEDRVRLRAKLCLKIAEDGTVSDIAVKGSSGSQIYDADVAAAARRASPLPAPPPAARRQAADEVCFNFCPKSCR